MASSKYSEYIWYKNAVKRLNDLKRNSLFWLDTLKLAEILSENSIDENTFTKSFAAQLLMANYNLPGHLQLVIMDILEQYSLDNNLKNVVINHELLIEPALLKRVEIMDDSFSIRNDISDILGKSSAKEYVYSIEFYDDIGSYELIDYINRKYKTLKPKRDNKSARLRLTKIDAEIYTMHLTGMSSVEIQNKLLQTAVDMDASNIRTRISQIDKVRVFKMSEQTTHDNIIEK